MREPTYSFVYDQRSAAAAFHGIAPRELTLSILAGLVPEEGWEGCLVYQGPSPLRDESICLATSGPGAEHVQLRMIEAFESPPSGCCRFSKKGPRWLPPSRFYETASGLNREFAKVFPRTREKGCRRFSAKPS
jgi:hypothetical protein